MSKIKNVIFTIILMLLLISLLAACAPAATYPGAQLPHAVSNYPGDNLKRPTATTSRTGQAGGCIRSGNVQDFGNENFLPWLDQCQRLDLLYAGL